MNKTIIALAQSVPLKGNVQENISSHKRLTALAADNDVQLLVFPELSLTGYEPALAEALAFEPDDERLQPLKALAHDYNMIIVIGAPLRGEAGLHIAAFTLFPDGSVQIYTKQFLHPGEEKVFVAGTLHHSISLAQEKISLAICADIANPLHAQWAAEAESSVYIASAFISNTGYQTDADFLRGYARKHAMLVMMANFGGNSGGYQTAGRSAVWSEKGDLIAEFDGLGEGLVVATKEAGKWAGSCIKPNPAEAAQPLGSHQ